MEWSSADAPLEFLLAQTLLAIAWIGCQAIVLAPGSKLDHEDANVPVAGRGKLSYEALESFAGFCAPSTFHKGGGVDPKEDSNEKKRAWTIIRDWASAASTTSR